MAADSPTIRHCIVNSLLVAVIAATWDSLWLATRHSKGPGDTRSVMALVVLMGITAVLQHMLRKRAESWLKSAALAGPITVSVMAGDASVGPILDYIEFG